MATFWDTLADIGENVGAGAYGAINSALFGLPDLLVEGIGGGQARKDLEAFRAEHPIGSTIGDIGGMFIVPGGAVLKGAGKLVGLGAKALGAAPKLAGAASGLSKAAGALGKAGQFIASPSAGQGVGKLFAKGALTAAEYAVPRGIVKGDFSDLPASLALGGAGGAVLGKVAPKVGEWLGKKSTDRIIAGALGTTPKGLRSAVAGAAKAPGAQITAADRIKEQLRNLVVKGGVRGKKGMEAFNKAEDALFKKADEGFKAAGRTLGNSTDDIIANPEVQRILAQRGGAETLDRLIAEADSMADLGSMRGRLKEIAAQKFRGPQDAPARLESDASKALNDVLDDVVEKVVPDVKWKELLGRYGAKKAVQASILEDKLKLQGRPFGLGSDTFAKMAIGGGIGGAQGGFDFSSPEAAAKSLGNIAAGVAAGGILNKAVPSLLNKAAAGGSLASAKLAGKLGKPISNVVAEAGPRLVGKLGLPATDIDPQPQMAGQGEAGAPEPIDKAAVAVADATGADPAQVAEAAKQEAAAATNERFAGVIDNALMTRWAKNYSDQVDFDTFRQAVYEATGGYDPERVAPALFDDPKERASYLKQYALLKQYKAIDLEAMLDYQGAMAPSSEIMQNVAGAVGLQDPGFTAQKQALGQFEQLLKNLSIKPGQDLSKELQGLMQRQVKGILGNKELSREGKRAALEQLVANYGKDTELMFNLDKFRRLGLA